MPVPSIDEWQESVRAALRATDPAQRRLEWTRREGNRWDLHGDCPNCGAALSVLCGDLVASDSASESAALVELVVACDSCGAGGYIWVRGPRA